MMDAHAKSMQSLEGSNYIDHDIVINSLGLFYSYSVYLSHIQQDFIRGNVAAVSYLPVRDATKSTILLRTFGSWMRGYRANCGRAG